MSKYVLRGRVIDAISNQALEEGMVVVIKDSIDYVGPFKSSLVPENAEIIEIENGTIMPGFIDCHAHLGGSHSAGPLKNRTPFGDLLLGAAHEIGILLDAGFTGIRDMSRNGPYLSRAVERKVLRGPRIMPGGRVLGITSGHTDPGEGLTKEEVNRYSQISYLVDGIDDCLHGVREQFRLGAKFIKICATGGVSSPVDSLDDVQFSPEEMRVIVEEAKRHGTYVAAHCTTHAGMYQALMAGVTSIEHGVMADEKSIRLMAEKDATLVTTLAIALNVANFPGMPEYVVEKAKDCAAANIKTISMARKYGVRIALGTDYSNSPNTPYAEIGKEFESMTQAGMTPMEAIKAGTVNAAHLMKMSDKIGTLEKGKLADIVIAEGNPLQDIKCLGHKDNIKLVIKEGIIEKDLRQS